MRHSINYFLTNGEKLMMKTFGLFLGLFIFVAALGNTFSQDVPPSVGPAPYVYNKAPESPLFTDAIGTRCFTQISSSPTFQFGKVFLEGCAPTNIGAPFTITFPGGLVTRNGVVYTVNQSSPFQLWSIDTVTGTHTLVFNLTGVPQANLTGLVWDGTTMYGVSTSVTQSQIFTVNMTTGACTPIGVASAVCAGAIELFGRPGAQYSLFATDIVADNLYKINKTTGVFTLVGPLGQNINFGQGGTVDPTDNTFYTCCYTAGPELRKIDTTTGALGPILCTYTAQATGLAAVSSAPPPPPPGPQITYCRGGLNLPINDFQTTVDSILVFPTLGDDCIVTDVNVRIDSVLHTWDSDLSFYLKRNNISVKIINQVGGSGDNFIGTILNDSTITTIESGTAPFTGSYKPSNPLSAFNSNPGINGRYWKLSITDTAAGDTGVLAKWCLVIAMVCPVGGIQILEVPNYYFLNQNYPNPFNPVTNIKFGIPESGDVRLVVYDILGREVKTLLNEYKNPGTYEVQFDASNMASGIYFYSLQTQRGIETKRMLMVK
jgi:hypothetical protein